ncbi:hypothetical protein M0805_003343 [Coniferiporia weirii]|nr:hypothetical protein M0805_003343 [Coniferiporia weirii]
MEIPQGKAEVDFGLVDRGRLEHLALTHIRKQSLHPFNRLHSIAEDIDFVKTVRDKYSSQPMLANLRCGAWYCDPLFSNGEFAHFKSADGHYNGWSFNLRRPNLHILPLIRNSGGLTLVDSTRSGKRIPDSLSKTVPIWCSVVNRALKIRNNAPSDDWDVQLYTPPQSVSKQEHSQIEDKLNGWADSLAKSSYELPSLDKPLRPIWITPATTVFPTFDDGTPFFPIVCISASKLVEEGAERRREGYSYAQGAGDDHEYWSSGLTPDLFWKNKEVLLSAPESDFMDTLQNVVNAEALKPALSTEWMKHPTPVAYVDGLVSISTISDIPKWVLNQDEESKKSTQPFPCIIVRAGSNIPSNTPGDTKNPAAASNVLKLELPSDKKGGERSFKNLLPRCLEYCKQHFEERRSVCVACDTGKDLSVGIALVVLQTFFDDDGMLDPSRYGRKNLRSKPSSMSIFISLPTEMATVNKDTIRMRLHWIIASRPEANPSRATLKRVNGFFMSASHSHGPSSRPGE